MNICLLGGLENEFSKKIKPYNPFNGEAFNDGAVWELDHKLITGEITLEEYLKKIEEI